MPRLILFAACEKALFEKGTSKISLVSIFGKLLADRDLILSEPDPESRYQPIPWYAAGIWETEAGDDQHDWEVLLEVTQPNGLVAGSFISRLAIKRDSRRTPFVISAGAFPVGYEGVYTIRLSIRHGSLEVAGPWHEKGDYKIIVQFDDEESGDGSESSDNESTDSYS